MKMAMLAPSSKVGEGDGSSHRLRHVHSKGMGMDVF